MAVEAFGDAASEQGPDAVAIAEMELEAADWAVVVWDQDWKEGGAAVGWGSSVGLWVDPSLGAEVLEVCPWVVGAEGGQEEGRPQERAAAFLGVSCHGVGGPGGALEGMFLEEGLLEAH